MITTFVSGAGTTTLPLYVFGSIRKGVTPATNAVAAIMLADHAVVLLVGQMSWPDTRARRPAAASVDRGV